MLIWLIEGSLSDIQAITAFLHLLPIRMTSADWAFASTTQE